MNADRKLIKEQAARLRALRKEFYPSATTAARALNVAVPTYSAHENATREIKDEFAKVYARHFGVNVDWLMKEAGDKNHPKGPNQQAVMAQATSQRVVSRNPLLADYDVFRTPSAYIPGSKSGGNVFDIKPYAQSDGYVCEVSSMWPKEKAGSKRFLKVPGDSRHQFVLEDFLCLGRMEVAERFLIALRSGFDGIFPKNDRLLVDPTHIFPSEDGVFILVRKGQFIPVNVKSDERLFANAKDISFYTKRGGAIETMKVDEFNSMLVGKCVGFFHTLTLNDVFLSGFQ